MGERQKRKGPYDLENISEEKFEHSELLGKLLNFLPWLRLGPLVTGLLKTLHRKFDHIY